VTYKELLTYKHDDRRRLIQSLGYQGQERLVEMKIAQSVERCLESIVATCRDLPPKVYRDNSKNPYETLDPSQRLIDQQKELQRLHKIFVRAQTGGRGRWPRLPNVVSYDATCLLLGDEPYGQAIIVAAGLDFDPSQIGEYAIPAQECANVYWEYYSNNREIAEEQFEAFRKLRTPDGKPLLVRIRLFTRKWPEKLFRLVQKARCMYDGGDVPLDEFREAVSDNIEEVTRNIGVALTMIEYIRGINDPHGTATVADWSRREPGFALALSVIDCVWPISKGIPPVNAQGEVGAVGDRTTRELILDLVQNVIDLVQVRLDVDPEFEGNEFRSVREHNHCLGECDGVFEKVDRLTALVLALRSELVAYWVARYTIKAICESAFEHADKKISAAANRVSMDIITSLDGLIAQRRQYLRFGSDRLRGNVLKWFGHFKPDERSLWGGEARIVKSVFPNFDPDHAQHLERFSALIESLEMGDEACAAWMELANWSRGEGRALWKICRPDPDRLSEILKDPLFRRK
jgi:hypothetical protein